MSGKKIVDFFTPISTRASKRHRSSSSPSILDNIVFTDMADEKVGDLTQAQLMEGLSNLLDKKLANLATKEDLVKLGERVQILERENKLLREEVACLRNQERITKDKVLDLECRSRRNNLIFKGLTVPERTTDYCAVIRRFCSEVMGSEDSLWVNRAHPLGKNRSTIIEHLPNDGDIYYIMSRTKMLRNTGYVVHRDYPQEVRDKRAKLVKVRAEIERVTGRRKMPLIHDHLMVEGCRFTWEGDKLRAGLRDGSMQLKEVVGRDFTEFLAGLQSDESVQKLNPPRQASALPQTSAPPQASAPLRDDDNTTNKH